MALTKRYDPKKLEPELQAYWQQLEIYHFDPVSPARVFSIDTPPPTVSGKLHLGHTFSYSHPDFIARYKRMQGFNVFYPMGFDDNGLPTERLVEKQLGQTAEQTGRQAFIQHCLEISSQAEQDYQELWQRLGLSIDWRYTYRTIDARARRTAQLAFLRLLEAGLAYRQEAPALWCPECQTAIAQAELNDLDRESEFVTLRFLIEGSGVRGQGMETELLIATTRPELLAACVAVFVHPEDVRYQQLVGGQARVPLFDQQVPILADPLADPEKGTGAVMCCTFGDQTDVAWWQTHQLPLVEAIDRRGAMTAAAGEFAGLPLAAAHQQIKTRLQQAGFLLDTTATTQSLRVHERCDTPVEYISTAQWFVRVLDFKAELLAAGEQIQWHPAHMQARYRAWVENLNYDWCISRQRYYGVPFPLWYCQDCGQSILANPEQLPVDPLQDRPPLESCPDCGYETFRPESDIMDTWATSSLSPQIAGQWLGDESLEPDSDLFEQVYPFSLRPQAHEIIRTWAFYTIVQSRFHFDCLPWSEALISGWGIAGEGMGKISKSRGGGPMPPLDMIDTYSADAVRYWAASTGPGKDAIISEEKIQNGARLANKLWNVARFSQRFLEGYLPPDMPPDNLTSADRWLLDGLATLITRVTRLFEDYDYAAAKAESEAFFWSLADNYLEMAKQRLYDPQHPQHGAAQYCLHQALLTVLKLLAPLLPYITEAIYQALFAERTSESIHRSHWPQPEPAWRNPPAQALGYTLLEITTAVRRYKSEHNLSLGSALKRVQLATGAPELVQGLQDAQPDLLSVTRAQQIDISPTLDPDLGVILILDNLSVAVQA